MIKKKEIGTARRSPCKLTKIGNQEKREVLTFNRNKDGSFKVNVETEGTDGS